MPAGRVHDRIVLWGTPWVAGAAFWVTRSSDLTLWATGAYLFGGLMFSGDLDTLSRPWQRWGPFRWLWAPYRTVLRHRSFWSHGPLVGTALRLLYLGIWVGLVSGIVWCISNALGEPLWQWQGLPAQVEPIWQRHQAQVLALLAGLELGSLSHSGSDWLFSLVKRRRPKPRSTGS
ncbi:MAG: metal-binding protein [Gloeomargaritaceae cyanobacterium C42_A2020_066]|nr:metal-binding protein [Gloeomargaritaceae cyanobacterium C42_A2020_066]